VEEIRDTAVTQPLIVAMGLITAGQLDFSGATEHLVTAGHSIGEVTAASVAGALTAEQAITFAARRGAEMAIACQSPSTTMAAALGGEVDAVVAAIIARGLTPANRNGAGQIVAAGATEAIDDLVANPPAGTRFRRLQVAGAFHTEYMRPAELKLRTVAAELQPSDPRQILLSNADGTAVTDGRTVLSRLVAQVTRPVRWDLCLNTMRELGVQASIELSPAKTLTGIAKRELPGIELITIKTPEDLASAQQLLAGVSDRQPPAADGRVVSTSSQGIFTRARGLQAGAAIVGGTRLGTVRTNRDELAIVAPVSGVLAEWFRNDGDIVGAGLPVARLSTGSEE
ncbi:MAG: acyltransferase domain-containing protein, partial [Jatrophihabitantaceae bacterium]